MNRQTNKFHCDLRHPPKGEMDERAKQIQHDMLLAFVQIVDTHNRLIIESAKHYSSPATANVVDSHADEEG
tara:strand:+ start:398 stop:610 length:213 start_codon:yes stop_codon:yes gene_type:complete